MNFRKIPKVRLQVMVPAEVAERIGKRASTTHQTDNATATELICKGLGIDPAKFGIEPTPRTKAIRPSASSN